MEQHATFIAERPVANHAPELFSATSQGADPTTPLTQFAQKFAPELARRLSHIYAPGKVSVSLDGVRACDASQVSATDGALASYSAMRLGDCEAPSLIILDARPVLSLLDRALGGTGDVADPLPETFPLSAEIFAGRLETAVRDALTAAWGQDVAPAIQPMARACSIAELGLLEETANVLEASFAVTSGEHEPWSLTLVFPEEMAPLFGPGDGAHGAIYKPRGPAKPTDAPFADVTLQLSARLVEMRISFSQLAMLQPGDVLPVAIARSVPLKLGDRTIALGAVGEMDDRVALSITQAF
ncbi:MAG: FliM/FliN family flagellar motor switch protein [Novosphingobium sp.]